MTNITEFQEYCPSIESYWRSIILFGNNVASYKFALSRTLLELASQEKTILTLDDLAEPFSRYICEHLKTAPKQCTSQSSSFLDACRRFNDGALSKDELLSTTARLGFNNVIDAFHVVNGSETPIRFYEKDYSRDHKQIVLTDDVFKLKENRFSSNLEMETESRWNLVETAWALGVSRSLLSVKYDDESKLFFVNDDLRRKDVTSARGALNGYQKGKCFYCFDDITVTEGTDNSCDVDHFFPHALSAHIKDINFDGVWNLVLACPNCNRGEGGKFAKVPHIKYLERLHRRNEFLINSHHPLRETIIAQTGNTEQERRKFLNDVNKRALDVLLFTWETPALAEPTF